jgi:hypothetical protein
MAAADGGFETPEEAAERAVLSSYQRVLRRKMDRVALLYLGYLAVMACDLAFAVLALFYVPLLLGAVLTGFVVAELMTLAYTAGKSRERAAAEQAARPVPVTDGDRLTAVLDDMSRLQRHPQAKPWWRLGPRRLVFWQGLAVRGVYSCCAGLVLSSWAGVPAGVPLAVAYTGLALVLGSAGVPAVSRLLAAASFADPRPPRDSPEA